MKFEAKIDMSNAAFDADPEGEIKRILVDALPRLVFDGEIDSVILHDVNGNRVGALSLTTEYREKIAAGVMYRTARDTFIAAHSGPRVERFSKVGRVRGSQSARDAAEAFKAARLAFLSAHIEEFNTFMENRKGE